MKARPSTRNAHARGWTCAALAAAALLFLSFAAPTFGQGLPSEQDPGVHTDREAGEGPPLEADTPAAAEPETPEKPPPGESGLKVPRFASLRSGEVNVRTGPGTRYPVEWVFQKRGLPVEITAEFGTWRRIRDSQGGEGWVHRSMLTGRRTAVITAPVETLRRRASADAAAVARAEQGVLATVRTCRDQWCEIESQGFRGWVPATGLWGVYPNETIK